MAKTHLQVGRSAPQFIAVDVFGNEINLKEYTAKHVLLVFLRYSGCPWCNLTIHRLTLEQERLKKGGCEIIAFVQSEPVDVIANIYNRHQHTPAFPIIADKPRKFYDQYGVRESKGATVRSITDIPFWVKSITKGFAQKKLDGDLFLVPASFLISPNTQHIINAHYSTSFYDHIVFEEIYSHLYTPGNR